MHGRFRMVVLLDMREETRHERAVKRRFCEWLFQEGFAPLQRGVLTRVVEDPAKAGLIERRMRENAPDSGIVRVFTMTERQFQQGTLLAGEDGSQESEVGAQADIFL